ncbi:MAG: PucR family transcriptional regulator [Hornefia butyriciproducens]|nr:PucR family transcriptional regulator [Hornefia butyriciproducens]
MALTVKDILKLPCADSFVLAAGRGGLERPVQSAEILDYEFAPDVAYDAAGSFNPDSVVLSSLLFAKDRPDLLLPAVRELSDRGSAALIYKQAVFKTLPQEVLDFADKMSFPVFCYREGTWFENIIFDIIYAIRQDDSSFLTSDVVDQMIRGNLGRESQYRISHGISLLLKEFSAAVYFRPGSSGEPDVARVENSYYLSKGIKTKVLPVPYDDGLFLLMTARRSERSAFEAVFREAADVLGIPCGRLRIVWSGIHPSHECFGEIFREAYYGWLAASMTGMAFHSYADIGVYQFLIPLADSPAMTHFSAHYAEVVKEYEGTCTAWIQHGGDATATAAELRCHVNTVHYRLSRIKERIGHPEYSDSQLFRDLSIAYVALANRKG